jgi:two-component system nitrogen regulation sensor histidine kinase NtrY
MMTLVILVAATWLGFYLAKQISIPLVQLGRATKRVVKGDYDPIVVNTGSEELASLVDNFNQMTSELETTYKNLDEHSRYIEVVLRSVSAGVISVDRSGVITTINRHAQELLKLDPVGFVGKPVASEGHLEFFKSLNQMMNHLSEHGLESLQKETQLNMNGEVLPLQLTLSQMRDDKGHNIGQILVFDDLTPIVNAQRSAAWTEVARRIAHEIKNPLTPIRISAERLQRKFGEQITDPAFKECTTMIVRQVDEMKTLVNEFSQFARMPQAKPVIGSIQKVIEDALSVFRTSHPQIQFQIDIDRDVPEFKFDPEQMRRALVNLIDNAIAATSKESKPEVGVSTRFQKELQILTLCVFDNGAGIPMSQRNRVFEPYYSTKEGGTGLGLPIVKRIIEDHNGLIRAMGNEPRGTKMLIEIPVYSAV